ncbi:protein transporter tim10 [Lobulomyces angularis]|nr:protein transporter tim10 [Lobulomyces angularis]
MNNSLAVAEQELMHYTRLYNGIVNGCHKKCINNTYHEAELNKGEGVCIDRCVSKYFEVHTKVGAKLFQNNQQLQQ